MTETRWTANAIKQAVRATGSHWFDPDTMRFFGTRVLPTVYQGPGGVYFVTSEQPPHGKRACTVRSFDPATSEIDTVGEVANKTEARAKKIARDMAAGNQIGEVVGHTTEDYQPVSVLEQFIDDLKAHGCTHFSIAQATSLILRARRHHALMEKRCNDEAFCRKLDEEGNHPLIVECRRKIEEEADIIGCKGVLFSGDPRGCTVKLIFEDGFTNDFAHEGYCVPTDTK